MSVVCVILTIWWKVLDIRNIYTQEGGDNENHLVPCLPYVYVVSLSKHVDKVLVSGGQGPIMVHITTIDLGG